ncbi:hypothetical protein [Belnapia moabensis]|uniref:hypothetical protein n=1 Tax=Belnapia moabensis TaxID=365533 RepID=UPI0005BC8014|nr:hypothetical protein [Belnapia moabensis]
MAETHYFAGCCGTCPRTILIGVEAATGMMGSGAATVGELGRRLKCGWCNTRVDLQIAVDSRSLDWIEREGWLPETMGRIVRDGAMKMDLASSAA